MASRIARVEGGGWGKDLGAHPSHAMRGLLRILPAASPPAPRSSRHSALGIQLHPQTPSTSLVCSSAAYSTAAQQLVDGAFVDAGVGLLADAQDGEGVRSKFSHAMVHQPPLAQRR